jgi:hypothetical protein
MKAKYKLLLTQPLDFEPDNYDIWRHRYEGFVLDGVITNGKG